MIQKGDMAVDPRGLIYEAYRIEGIDDAQCRTIFLDWAMGLPDGENATSGMAALLSRYGGDAPDHPMSVILRDGLKPRAGAARRTKR